MTGHPLITTNKARGKTENQASVINIPHGDPTGLKWCQPALPHLGVECSRRLNEAKCVNIKFKGIVTA